jgi:5-methylcytosine-specific restriction endonuclease McrA
MKQENTRCLVLNGDYSPLIIVDWKRAITWLTKENSNIEIIDFYKDDYIQGTCGKKYPIPSVIKSKTYYRLNSQRVNFSRKNVFIRDDFTCQYCGLDVSEASLTYDHIIPKSVWNRKHGSPTTWTNIVTACVKCNNKKGNRTPEQAKMKLLNHPYIPTKHTKYLPITHFLSRIRDDIPSEWSMYLNTK